MHREINDTKNKFIWNEIAHWERKWKKLTNRNLRSAARIVNGAVQEDDELQVINFEDEFDLRRWWSSTEWEGSAADGRVLRDAIGRPNGFKVPKGTHTTIMSKILKLWL